MSDECFYIRCEMQHLLIST